MNPFEGIPKKKLQELRAQLNSPGLFGVPKNSFQYLKAMRDSLTDLGYGPKSDIQEFVAEREHEAFAREWVEDDVAAAPLLLGAIPAYAGLKSIGWKPDSTPPSLAQMAGGYRGMWQGLRNRLEK